VRLDEKELRRWGQRIGASIETPVFIGLSGPLGAGKSVLARAIGAGAGVDQAMPSPSYNLAFRYATPSGREVVHLDLYRVSSPDELWELGWEQLGARNDLAVVEWPERALDRLPPDHWLIELSVPEDLLDRRDVSVRRIGAPPELPAFPLSVSLSGE
jgi:tRNA threonylcarbamoyladenosine biosynthesis protein TsaE